MAVTAPRRSIDAADLPAVLRSVLGALVAARREVDNLNVFPVPDGDTGSNLVATVRSAVEAVDEAGTDDPAELTAAAARGALRGAAGNSGVIFSQVLRAVAEQLAEGPLDAATLGDALARARDLSYRAVAEPLPGTILSAMDAAAECAEAVGEEHVEAGHGLAEVLREVLAAVADAVDVSRDVLEANRLAGVVDAGARGFEVALDGVLAHLEGREVDVVDPPAIRRTDDGAVAHRESGSLAYAFEVQYLLDAPDEAADEVRDRLEVLGDSVVVVACGGLVNVHVHTNEVEAAIDVGREHGRLSRLLVTRFADQVDDTADTPVEPGGAADAAGPAGDTVVVEVVGPDDAPRSTVGYLAVVPGTGLASLVRAMGAVAVSGTVGALPTVATVLNAVGSVRADDVVLLPGHPNVVATMHQASAVSVAEGGRALHVVAPADSVPAVLAVLAVADDAALDEEALAAAATAVAAGEVVPAVRDADTPIGPVRRGQWLAVGGGDVLAACDEPVDAVRAVVDALVVPDHELATVVVGAGVPTGERVRVRDVLAELAPHVEVELVDGGQRPARWIVGLE